MAASSAQSAESIGSRPAERNVFDLPQSRLRGRHAQFPYTLLAGNAADGYLAPQLEAELSYVKDHCMFPPYPWGQIFYHNFIVDHLIPGVDGDFAEFGVGQGGTSVFLARLAKKYQRKCLAVDSFEGLPPVDLSKDNHYFVEGDYRPIEGVDNYENFMQYKSKFDVDDSMHVIKGFFKDADIPPEFETFAFAHLDSDLYDSVWDSLEKIWDRISPGGCVAVDDFFHHAQGPARAVGDFFRKRAGEDPPLLFVIPTYAVLIIKGVAACAPRSDPSRPSSTYAPRALDGNFYSFQMLRSCEPFLRAAEDCAKYAAEACANAEQAGEPVDGLLRARGNADAFLSFLRYPEDAARSGNDIMRYLTPLEDLFDSSQGTINGVQGNARKTIEFRI